MSKKVNIPKTVKAPKDKIIKMCEMELDLDEKTIKGLCEYALKEIKNDRDALVNYAANKILTQIVETDGECLKPNE